MRPKTSTVTAVLIAGLLLAGAGISAQASHLMKSEYTTRRFQRQKYRIWP